MARVGIPKAEISEAAARNSRLVMFFTTGIEHYGLTNLYSFSTILFFFAGRKSAKTLDASDYM
jgi:hypothetical protein